MPKSSIAPQVSVSLLFLGSACFIAFGLIGSHVDSSGLLREPFALLPIGWALIAAGALIGAYGLTRAGWRTWSRRRR